MTEDLYRQEALDHKARGLYGEVTLSAPPASWLITFLLIIVLAILCAILFLGQIDTESGPISVLQWLTQKEG